MLRASFYYYYSIIYINVQKDFTKLENNCVESVRIDQMVDFESNCNVDPITFVCHCT